MYKNLNLPISPSNYVNNVVPEAEQVYGSKFSDECKTMLAAIALQESGLAHRWQVVDAKNPAKKGPARGLHQFELGTEKSRGGVWGIYLHKTSRPHLHRICGVWGIEFTPQAIYAAIEASDVFSTICARLLLLTDPRALPKAGSFEASWDCYNRNWRPGKPHPDKWPVNYQKAMDAVYGASV